MSLASKEMIEEAKADPQDQPPQDENKGEQQTASPTQDRPEYIPEKFWDAEAKAPRVNDLGKAYTELMRSYTLKTDDLKEQLKQEELSKRRPVSPDEYGVDFGDEIKIPPHAKLDVSQDNPLVKSVQEWAHENGVPKEAYSKLLRMYVENEVKGIPDFDAEMAKLGDNGPQRITSLLSRAKSVLDDSEMGEFTDLIMSAKQVEVLEKVLGQKAKQGPTSFESDVASSNTIKEELTRLKSTDEYWKGDKYTRERVLSLEQRLQGRR